MNTRGPRGPGGLHMTCKRQFRFGGALLFVALAFGGQALAERDHPLVDHARIVDHESTEHILRVLVRTPEKGRSETETAIYAHLTKVEQHIARDFEAADKLEGPAREQAMAKLHERFWEVMDKEEVRQSLGGTSGREGVRVDHVGTKLDQILKDRARKTKDRSEKEKLDRAATNLDTVRRT